MVGLAGAAAPFGQQPQFGPRPEKLGSCLRWCSQETPRKINLLRLEHPPANPYNPQKNSSDRKILNRAR